MIDLEKQLIPNISLDYLTLNCTLEDDFHLICDEIKKIKPNLKILDNRVFKNQFDTQNDNQKIQELQLDYHLIRDQIRFRKSRIQIRIPGSFAQNVLQALLNNLIDFSHVKSLSCSRIDLKFTPPNFILYDFNLQTRHLAELHKELEKKNHKPRLVFEHLFTKLTNGARSSPRFDRAYVSFDKITFDIELKSTVAKKMTNLILLKDIFGINQLFLIETISCLTPLPYCHFTKPLKDWNLSTLYPLKDKFFPDHKIIKRYNKVISPTNDELLPCKVEDLVKKDLHFVNFKVIQVMHINEEDNAKLLMVLIFCTKLLMNKWSESQDYQNISQQISSYNWNPIHYCKDSYSITFELNELIEF